MLCIGFGPRIITNVSASDPRPKTGGYIAEKLTRYSQISAIANALRQISNAKPIELSPEDRTTLNLIIHADAKTTRNGQSNPYYGADDKKDLAKAKLREFVRKYIPGGTLKRLEELRDQAQGK